jgi:hypothetical protein
MSNGTDQQAKANTPKGSEKVPQTGSHEDFGQNAGTDAPGGKVNKDGRKEETGATEAGNVDMGAKQ